MENRENILKKIEKILNTPKLYKPYSQNSEYDFIYVSDDINLPKERLSNKFNIVSKNDNINDIVLYTDSFLYGDHEHGVIYQGKEYNKVTDLMHFLSTDYAKNFNEKRLDIFFKGGTNISITPVSVEVEKTIEKFPIKHNLYKNFLVIGSFFSKGVEEELNTTKHIYELKYQIKFEGYEIDITEIEYNNFLKMYSTNCDRFLGENAENKLKELIKKIK
jgi:hypothetical protein